MTSKTRAALTTEQTTNFADNTTGAITPAILRATVQDMIDSTGTLLDSNAWTGSAYSFTGSVAFSGVVAHTATLFVASTGGILGGSASTSSLIMQSTNFAVPAGDQVNISGSSILLHGQGSVPSSITLGVAGSAYGTLGFAGSTSGTTTIQATAAASGTQTLQAATDTFVYLATSDTLTNKTINITASTNSILVNGFIPGGRLTAATGTPIMTSTVSSATSHFYTPYSGQLVPIYNGTNFIWTDTGGELSQTTADSTKSPASVATNSAYDIFVWNDSGTVRATRGKVWTSLTSRADALSRINGIYTNGTTVTNGPAQNRGTYVGTIASNGSGNIDWVLGAAASGGTAASLNVWNQYNRVDVVTNVTDNGTSYTPANNTLRQARGSTGNQVTIVSGNPEDGIEVTYASQILTGATAGDGSWIGYGLDSTTTFGAQSAGFLTATANAVTVNVSGTWFITPQTGRHIISANEQQQGATNNSNFDNQSLAQFSVKFRM